MCVCVCVLYKSATHANLLTNFMPLFSKRVRKAHQRLVPFSLRRAEIRGAHTAPRPMDRPLRYDFMTFQSNNAEAKITIFTEKCSLLHGFLITLTVIFSYYNPDFSRKGAEENGRNARRQRASASSAGQKAAGRTEGVLPRQRKRGGTFAEKRQGGGGKGAALFTGRGGGRVTGMKRR